MSRAAHPRVSIVVTCYNYARFLAEALDSVLAQTYGDFELIVVNDGSTDDTDDVISPYLSEARVEYLKQPNGGQAAAKNRGIRHSVGDYVAFLDADDLWAKTKLERQVPLFEDPGVGVVYSRMRLLNPDSTVVDYRPPSSHLEPKRGCVTSELFFDNFIPFSSAVVRRACLDGRGAFDESLKMSIDWDLWLRLSLDNTFDYVDEPLLLYRQGHAGQMSKSGDVRLQCADRVMKRFVARHPTSIPKAVVRRAWAYSYSNRGWYFRDKNMIRSTLDYIRSLRVSPFQSAGYRGLAGNLVLLARRAMARLVDGRV